jgi:transitional endoplasmic reticulum ATPase
VVFFDEIDSIAPIRGMEGVHASTERMMSQLLTEMDGIQEMQGVVIIAATNRVDMIDTALLRPGRFDKIVLVSNPDRNTREKILEIHIRGKPVSKDIDLGRIADLTDGFSGADMSAVANTAISVVLQEYLAKYSTPEEAARHTSEALVSMKQFEEAIKKIKTQREMKPGDRVVMPHYR